ncbi:MerR family transcriptional regulator [Enterococcus sp. LJL120]
MFKIGEFSKLTQVSIRMLRYYDENELLAPARIDPQTNYRLYSAQQIPRLNKILFLKDLGFTVAEISTALKKWQGEDIINLLQQRRELIENQILLEQAKLAKIALAEKDILTEKIKIHYNVTIKTIPQYQVISLRRIVKDYFQEGYLWKELSQSLEPKQLKLAKESFSIYHDPEYKTSDVDIEVCLVLAETKNLTVSAPFTIREVAAEPLMASTLVYGPFENINDAFLAFAGWLEEHPQYQMGAYNRQIVHRGPWEEDNPENYLTEIQIPIRERQ